MTEPRRVSQGNETGGQAPPASPRLPSRAYNLARRMLDVENQCNGRGRVTVDLVMVNGIWVLMVGKIEKVEHLSE